MSQAITDQEFPRDRVGPRPSGWWGIMLAIAVFATSYSAMYFSYVYIRVGTDAWPPEGIDPPDLTLPIAAYAALLVASLPAWRIVRRVRSGRMGGIVVGLLPTFVLGAAYIALQVAVWGQADFSYDTHVYGSLFFVFPAVHMLSVAGGLVMVAVVSLRTRLGHIRPAEYTPLSVTAAWWHFLAIGGAGIFVTVYIIPHVWRMA